MGKRHQISVKMKYIDKHYIFVTVVSIIIWLVSFFYEDMVFLGSRKENFFVWIFCRMTLLSAIICAGVFLLRAITISDGRERRIFLYAIPYFVLLLLVWFKTPMELRSGDDVNVFNEVIYFNLWPRHFSYFTGMFNILSLMLIPTSKGIVLFKLIFQSLCCGYVVEKSKSKWLYLLFLLPPMLDSSYLLQRLYMYGLVYIVFFLKLYFDYKENRKLDRYCLVTASVLGAILTIWRREGIVFIILAPIVIVIAYKVRTEMKKVVVSFLLILLLVAIPELFSYTQGASTAYEETAGYVRFIQDMLYEGIDREKYAEDLEVIDKVVSVEAMDSIIEKRGIASYDGLQIRHVGTEWYGMRDNPSVEEIENFENTVIRIIKNEPAKFLSTRIKVFLRSMTNGTALYYGTRNPIQVYGSNIWLPLISIIVCFVFACFKKNGLLFWFNLNHFFLLFFVFALAPSSYFKYYYVIYLMGYVYMLLVLDKIFNQLKKRRFNKV